MRRWREAVLALNRQNGCPWARSPTSCRGAPGAPNGCRKTIGNWRRLIEDGLVKMQDRGELAHSANPADIALAVLTAVQAACCCRGAPSRTGRSSSHSIWRLPMWRRKQTIEPLPDCGVVHDRRTKQPLLRPSYSGQPTRHRRVPSPFELAKLHDSAPKQLKRLIGRQICRRGAGAFAGRQKGGGHDVFDNCGPRARQGRQPCR